MHGYVFNLNDNNYVANSTSFEYCLLTQLKTTQVGQQPHNFILEEDDSHMSYK